MLVRTYGSALHGVDAITITVEVNWMESGTGYQIVGLPDNAIKESLLRVESALRCLHISLPRSRCVINLAPADLRKSGTAFDLAIALGFLASSGAIDRPEKLEDYVVMGELGLNGDLRPIRGALSIASQALQEGFTGLILPSVNAREAAMVSGLKIYGLDHIREVLRFFNEGPQAFQPEFIDLNALFHAEPRPGEVDFADVKGQEHIKRALEIAAAGGHNAVLIGPPGAGKTMLARRLPTILPPLTLTEALETTRIHSVAGKLTEHPIVSRRPFRSPHHSISDAALVGGGSLPQPGEISLAHHGVLFLDELPEFKRSVLEVMRQPMEERRVTISRARLALEFPASFMLIASMNPCPCGFYNHPEKNCTCPAGAVHKYVHKISGPLMDRIDLHVEVTPLHFSQISQDQPGEHSSDIRKRVVEAREFQKKRFIQHKNVHCNAQMDSRMVREACRLNDASETLLRTAMEKLNLSARAYDRILKVARTVADLAGSDQVHAEHLAEAIHYRSLDRESWASSTPF